MSHEHFVDLINILFSITIGNKLVFLHIFTPNLFFLYIFSDKLILHAQENNSHEGKENRKN